METPSLSSHLDEDDFDWEAAVREIDSVCERTISSTYSGGENALIPQPNITNGGCPRPGVPRQSTLDRFVDTYAKKESNSSICCESDFQEPVAGDLWERNNPSGPEDGATSVSIDLEAAKTWIYPINVPLRDYQFAIAKTALFSNTLVALPTGLGKTLIAAVVMYNYFRWFPEGKIVFSAPSRPLVMQQIEACHNIVGIPQEWTIDMTGQMSPPKRSKYWKAKRVFFLTPQVFEKDIQSGICMVKQLVCLVFDEAHRAMGNYSYCVVVRELMAMPMHLRILALTATPGSKHPTIQNVIDNLCISTLEYRNENDDDVNSYMHSRKLELIQVPMGKDSVEINSMLLQAIQPFITRLNDLGALPHRNFAALSPSELLNLRDKFRQAPPNSLPYSKYGEVEAYFSLLITFYHIRKLLSSHGIRPAYEMIQDKLTRGSFSKLVSKIEVFWKAKTLMQQSLNHGAPTPKVVKMLEILLDHFKTKDSNNSRVIIFSNFRGSVRDIMSYLPSIGDMVKAAEFIGQSSGRSSKGQTQKVQQAVLEKFRSGGYNILVATSIGEEGLDIMEVDLVICFDANVSPLRMIQRMGRTGRKNDGRVVVLACEGSELKSYLKKQASSKAMRKHMYNGGIKSFNFHPSPRMVPHVCKPQVQYLEMSIEQFVHRGKKLKKLTMDSSPFLSNISNDEQSIIAKYFPQTKDATWRPSLIAFPSFQVFPSQVSRVRHSFKTTSMFIEAMQDLQGRSFSKANNDDLIEVGTSSQPHNEKSASRDNIGQGLAFRCTGSEIGNIPFHGVPTPVLEDKVGFHMYHHDVQKLKPHCFLYSKDSVTVSSSGSVLIAYVPIIQHGGSKCFEGIKPGRVSSPKVSGRQIIQMENPKIKAPTEMKQLGNAPPPNLIIQAIQNEQENMIHVFQTPDCKSNHQDMEKSATKINCNVENVSPTSVGRSTNEAANIELSPRLTHFIQEGIVPESPNMKFDLCSPSDKNQLFSTYSRENGKDTRYQTRFHGRLLSDGLESHSAVALDTLVHSGTPPNIVGNSDMSSKEIFTHQKKMASVKNAMIEDTNEKNIIHAKNDAVHTPNTIIKSSSEDWKFNSGEASNSFFRAHKYKRLRRQGDVVTGLPVRTLEKRFGSVEAACGSIMRTHENTITYRNGRKEKSIKHVDAFVEVEAEVSDDASVSEDEVADEKYDRYDDSFIDDRINPTEGSTEAENSGVDMTAFYRRSLLTQSPVLMPRKYPATSGESLSSETAGSCSPGQQQRIIETPLPVPQSVNQPDCQNSIVGNAASTEVNHLERCSDKLERRKRKLFFQASDAIPEENPTRQEPQSLDTGSEIHTVSSDDDFFQGLDLDEIEAQATEILRCRSELSVGKKSQALVRDPDARQIDQGTTICPPLFDLGI